MTMRIIGGTARGVKLLCPKGQKVRPIPDRVREALFNIIGNDLEDKDFLDLFAGTGSVGIESLSRGARRAVLVDRSRRHIEIIIRNLERANLRDRAIVILGDAFRIATRLNVEDVKFSVIFIGPPYNLFDNPKSALRFHQLFRSIADSNVLLPETLFIVQSRKRSSLSEISEGMSVIDRREYGNTALTFMTMDSLLSGTI